jgi:plastocyanin
VNTTAPASANAPRLRRVFAALLMLGLIVLAGCGSSSGSSSSSSSSESAPAASTPAETPSTSSSSSEAGSSAGAGSSVSLSANPEGQLEYSTKSLSAKAGKVSIDFTNTSPVGHNVTIESSSGSTVGATETFQGASKTLSVNLKPGTYKFYCSVPGHRQAGMEGTLTVK